MTTVREIYNTLFAFAPASMKMDWDNVGLLCGRFDAPVDTVLVALDPMPRPTQSTTTAMRSAAFWNWQKRKSPRLTCIRISMSAPAA